jgi:hypothetical protein
VSTATSRRPTQAKPRVTTGTLCKCTNPEAITAGLKERSAALISPKEGHVTRAHFGGSRL